MKPALPRHLLGSALDEALALFEPMANRIGRQARRWRSKYNIQRALADFEAQLQRLRPGDICLDLGANVGDVTLRMARTGATVHAYEPDPVAWAVLVQRAGHLPNVVLHHCCVAAKTGRFSLRRLKGFASNPLAKTVGSSIAPTTPERDHGIDAIEVDALSFGDVVRSVGGPVALVKMDIEGSEFAILRQIFAHPAAYDIASIYCETHERAGYGDVTEVDSMRRAACGLDRPAINLYWP